MSQVTFPWTTEEEEAYLATKEAQVAFQTQLNLEIGTLILGVKTVLENLGYRVDVEDAASLLREYATLLPLFQKVEASVAIQQAL